MKISGDLKNQKVNIPNKYLRLLSIWPFPLILAHADWSTPSTPELTLELVSDAYNKASLGRWTFSCFLVSQKILS